MQKREARKILIRQNIIDACIKLLGEWSLADITINEICREAGVARQTLYNYFDSKEEIIDEASQMVMFDGTIRSFDSALKHQQGTLARLDETFSQVGEPMRNYQGENIQVFIQLIQNLTLRMSVHPSGLVTFHETARRYFESCAQNDDTKDFDVDFIAKLTVTSLVGIVLSWVSNQAFPAQQSIAELKEHIAQLILQ